ncbi:hypothetical protein QF037_003292 [Streptomyces canus]|nr:hypothetical protein [Streptomyces canus]
MRVALPRWAGTLAVKAAAFITVMCCALAALLGVLVHVSVTNQTVGQARDLALQRLEDATSAYEAGGTPGPFAGVDPPGLPGSLRDLAVAGDRGTMVATRDGDPTMWAAGPRRREPGPRGPRRLPPAGPHHRRPRPVDPVVLGTGDRGDAAGGGVRGDPGDPAAARHGPGGPADQRG